MFLGGWLEGEGESKNHIFPSLLECGGGCIVDVGFVCCVYDQNYTFMLPISGGSTVIKTSFGGLGLLSYYESGMLSVFAFLGSGRLSL